MAADSPPAYTRARASEGISGLYAHVNPHAQKGATFNQSVARTDKWRKPRFLCLTGGLGVPVFTEMDATGVILER